MIDEYMIEEKFDRLISDFSFHTISDFSACLFSLDYKNFQKVSEFDKFIYTKGNEQEVYTKKERDIIGQIQGVCIISEWSQFLKQHRITCRIIALDLRSSVTSLYDAVAGMKICNKALDSYNTYILVCEDKIFVGCDSFRGASKTNCEISYPIKKGIDWDALFYLFLNTEIDKDFLCYYHTLIDVVEAVDDCYYTEKNENNDNLFIMSNEDDAWCDLSDESLYIASEDKDVSESDINRISDYHLEVCEIMAELSYIESNKVNPLEMLFETEKTGKSDEEWQMSSDNYSDHLNLDDDKLRLLHEDPETLIKALSKRHK